MRARGDANGRSCSEGACESGGVSMWRLSSEGDFAGGIGGVGSCDPCTRALPNKLENCLLRSMSDLRLLTICSARSAVVAAVAAVAAAAAPGRRLGGTGGGVPVGTGAGVVDAAADSGGGKTGGVGLRIGTGGGVFLPETVPPAAAPPPPDGCGSNGVSPLVRATAAASIWRTSRFCLTVAVLINFFFLNAFSWGLIHERQSLLLWRDTTWPRAMARCAR